MIDRRTFSTALAAAAAGALLAIAGAVMQRLTANPLASPEVLGVSGGAALGYAAAVFAWGTPAPATPNTARRTQL